MWTFYAVQLYYYKSFISSLKSFVKSIDILQNIKISVPNFYKKLETNPEINHEITNTIVPWFCEPGSLKNPG